jgi:hypothetical protein
VTSIRPRDIRDTTSFGPAVGRSGVGSRNIDPYGSSVMSRASSLPTRVKWLSTVVDAAAIPPGGPQGSSKLLNSSVRFVVSSAKTNCRSFWFIASRDKRDLGLKVANLDQAVQVVHVTVGCA